MTSMADSTHEARPINDRDVFYERNLEETLQELQSIVKEHEDALIQVPVIPLVIRVELGIS